MNHHRTSLGIIVTTVLLSGCSGTDSGQIDGNAAGGVGGDTLTANGGTAGRPGTSTSTGISTGGTSATGSTSSGGTTSSTSSAGGTTSSTSSTSSVGRVRHPSLTQRPRPSAGEAALESLPQEQSARCLGGGSTRPIHRGCRSDAGQASAESGAHLPLHVSQRSSS